MLKKVLLSILAILVIILVGGYFFAKQQNSYQTDGELTLTGLQDKVKVIRDEKGMPYIYAENRHDLLMAQGFVMAQDRLFQMQLTRMFAEGRIAELAGEKAENLDLKHRTLGFLRLAKQHLKKLSPKEVADLQAFADGVNQFIDRDENIHLEFSLAGISPEQWKPEASIAILYYMGWDAASNLVSEMIFTQLGKKIGQEKLQTLMPIHTNLDDTAKQITPNLALLIPKWEDLANVDLETHWELPKGYSLKWGSNMWVTDASKSTSGKPILAGDPHLDSRIMPGTMYSCGLITPEMRSVGIIIPGLHGLIIGRNQYIANSLTNGYLDMQDLYILPIDPENPENYLIGSESIPFQSEEETFRIKMEGSTKVTTKQIRFTKFGVVVNELFPEFPTDKVLVLRWSAAENMKSSLGISHLLDAKSVKEANDIVQNATMACHNVMIADIDGNIRWRTIGTIPKRMPNTGQMPTFVTDSTDTWLGFVSADSMPQQLGSETGWIGNANHNTIKADYPHYVSNQFSPYYRYKRLKQLLESKPKFSASDHWGFQRDYYNTLAAKIAPTMALILSKDAETKEMGEKMANWDFMESKESVATTIYQRVYRQFAWEVFQDELGNELAMTYLKRWYVWQERLETMMIEGESEWFDDVSTTEQTESFNDIMIKAAKKVKEELTQEFGANMSVWTWGKAHQIHFVNPLAREGAAKDLLGKSFEMAGSGETLYRAKFPYDKPDDVQFAACIRMVVDLADSDKVMAIMSGGTTGRTFHKNLSNQLEPFMDGTVTHWWFSDEAINNNKQNELQLLPQK